MWYNKAIALPDDRYAKRQKNEVFELKKGMKLILGAASVLLAAGVGAGAAVWYYGQDFETQRLLTEPIAPQTATETTAVSEATVKTEMTTTTIETSVQVLTELPADLQVTTMERLEVYQRVSLKDFVAATNGEVVSEGMLDTATLGDHEVTIQPRYEENIYETVLPYTVVDTTPPLILNSGGNAIHKIGKEFDLKNYIGYADNYDAAPILTYEGEINPDVKGNYPVHATVTDSSGNASEFSFHLQVVEEKPSEEPSGSKISFGDFCAKYAGENRSFGIDVSSWQKEIDFSAVKAAGCSFVIMRIAKCYDSISEDEYFTRNLQAARDAGLQVGVYLYTTANTREEILEQTAWLESKLGGTPLDFPVVFDWEDFSTFQEYEMSIHDLNSLFELFSQEMDRIGYGSILYSSKIFLQDVWENAEHRPVWLAHYVNETTYTGEYMMWQETPRGQIDGIAGEVDLDIHFDVPMNVQ